ncbi:maleylacetate reductase (plasmid) [Agrobacterium leguminum]|uniref:Maleylacetate reductase n=1 Tax=Agrobacterium deltaense NCPPB 1641 TaxID=1183425 RepID=A0A1S7UB65_9HYPH|nr:MULTISPECIES: maleylacetate reductase [Agrobacterium]WFS69745.1 maleylacetate reductase [Agrobacterium leguminum]CVI64055.1 Maleylacetate reductase [Agrobacterium deltaense NCPPB 1641]
MDAFTYNGQPSRVIFGSGTIARVAEEIDRLGLKKVLVLSTPPQEGDAKKLAAVIGEKVGGIFSGAVMHTPVTVTEQALEVLKSSQIDGLIALGGGSTTGLSKALALRTDLPQIVIPTTYAGSEMTPILGETKDGVKVTQSSPKILPEVVIYDVDLTMSLPAGLSGTSGINAIAHAVEALYAKEHNPIVSMMALEGISALHKALPLIAKDPSDRDARSGALYGAWLCGVCLGSVGMALHHKLCHTIGGSFDLPHAETHTIILPHALAYNAPAIPDVIAKLKSTLCTDDPSRALFDLAKSVGAATALSDIGMKEADIEVAVDRAFANPYWNPRPLEKSSIHGLITRAFAGDPPVVETAS